MITCLFWGYKSRKSAKSAKKGPPDFVFCSVCRRQDLCRQASVFEMDAYAIRSLSWEYRIVSHNSFIFVCSRNNNGKILMKPTRIIEICANSAQSCVEAEAGGAKRVELCAGIPEGGTTPSYGEIRTAQALTSSIDINVIIRPREATSSIRRQRFSRCCWISNCASS